jgi:hypothetical protein
MAVGVQSFPRIVRFLEPYESDTCPHCGATGRYVLRFQVEDGRTLGAMRGCVKLFPVSAVALEELRLRKKLADYQKRGWKGLNRNDTRALEAIEQFYAGTLDERSALGAVKSAKSANTSRYRR